MPVDINRLLTDIFDMGSKLHGILQGQNKIPMPDLSDKSISHLVTEEDKADRARFYNVTDAVPEIRVEKKTRLPFLDIIDAKFPSPIQTPFDENNEVYIRHFKLRNKPAGGPTVIMINGWYVNTYAYFDWWCWRFAAWGMSSVLIDIPYHIRRVPHGSYDGQLLIIPDTNWSLLSFKQTFQDVQALANWLKAQGVPQIGAFGVSFGALLSGLYVCNAQNADFAIMGMPPMDTVDVLKRSGMAKELEEKEAAGETTMLTDPCVPALFNMSVMTPNVPLNKIFIAAGELDHLVTPESVRGAAERWGGLPWLKFYPTGHINTFALNLKFIEDVRKFIKKEIKP